ncbi:MAG: hypothetical protein R3B06_26445 [Kofleriaceae bacterium]
MTPPKDEQGAGRIILGTIDSTHGDDGFRLRDWLYSQHVPSGGIEPAWREVVVDGAQVECLEAVGTARASCSCAVKRGVDIFAWGFIDGMDTAYYRRIEGCTAVANVVASLKPTSYSLP